MSGFSAKFLIVAVAVAFVALLGEMTTSSTSASPLFFPVPIQRLQTQPPPLPRPIVEEISKQSRFFFGMFNNPFACPPIQSSTPGVKWTSLWCEITRPRTTPAPTTESSAATSSMATAPTSASANEESTGAGATSSAPEETSE